MLEQETEAIVNPWNRNIFPWWLLRPHGVSGAIKREGGPQPFRELSHLGPISLGAAVSTSAGRLPYKAIIHVATINLRSQSSKEIIQRAIRNVIQVAERLKLSSIAFPLLGTGSGGLDPSVVEQVMLETFAELAGNLDSDIQITLVRFQGKRN